MKVTVSSFAEASKTENAALEAEALAKLPGTTGGQTAPGECSVGHGASKYANFIDPLGFLSTAEPGSRVGQQRYCQSWDSVS